MEAASCDGDDGEIIADSFLVGGPGYGENIVDSLLVGGPGGANACHYGVYCQTVYRPLAHRYELMREPTRHGIRTKQPDGGRPPVGHDQQHSRNPPRRGGI